MCSKNKNNYDVMQVCLNGHIITDYYYLKADLRKEYCPKCGQKTIIQCPYCQCEIKGNYKVSSSISIPSIMKAPLVCEDCGKPFPWNKGKKEDSKNNRLYFNSIDLIDKICEKFPVVVSNLNKRHNNKQGIDIEDEYDVQDVFRSLLFVFFDDVRVEEWIPSYAGSSKRADFLLKDEKIIIEVKKTRSN